ncbi:hypothetical protein [uncultured Clostridium sp.]|uniref:hypothetical protein n=1 Tax=uncultured Clostridium sp. TaxID=59620 RepID=UPI0025DC8B3B|nr:hypothetical protein [uncultured Clostridium sp.]
MVNKILKVKCLKSIDRKLSIAFVVPTLTLERFTSSAACTVIVSPCIIGLTKSIVASIKPIFLC